jgi:hypothetical protein
VSLTCVVWQNEDTLKKCMADYQSKLKKMEERYQVLKKQAEEKLMAYVNKVSLCHSGLW